MPAYCSDFTCFQFAPCPLHQKIKMIYFNARGRAEGARLILAEGKIEYEDYRFPTNHDNDTNPSRMNDAFLAIEPRLTWGQVPAMEVGSTMITQTRAIERYVAKRAGLIPEDAVQAAFVDSVAEALTDLQAEVIKTMWGKPEDVEAAKKEFAECILPRFGGQFSAVLTNSGSGFYGKEFCYVDLLSYALWDMINTHSGGKVLDAFPLIKGHCETVASRPSIKAYIAARPNTPF